MGPALLRCVRVCRCSPRVARIPPPPPAGRLYACMHAVANTSARVMPGIGIVGDAWCNWAARRAARRTRAHALLRKHPTRSGSVCMSFTHARTHTLRTLYTAHGDGLNEALLHLLQDLLELPFPRRRHQLLLQLIPVVIRTRRRRRTPHAPVSVRKLRRHP